MNARPVGSMKAHPHELVRAALSALGIERLVLAIHDVSFPSTAGDDIGRGSPYTRGGRALLGFARDLGFDGVQLGPQGQTSLGDPSPYDGSVFSKSILSVALAELEGPTFARLLPPAFLEEAVAHAPLGDSRAHYIYAFQVQARAMALAAAELKQRVAAGNAEATELAARSAAFAARAPWLAHDARFEAFAAVHGDDDWPRWPEHDARPTPGASRRSSGGTTP